MVDLNIHEAVLYHPAVRKDKKPLTVEKAGRISCLSERIFALAVCSRTHLVVIHEPCTFKSKNGSKTVPDFYILNLNNPNSEGIFIEVTTTPNIRSAEGKIHQKSVMHQVQLETPDQNIHYLQFNGAVLANIQQFLYDNNLIDVLDLSISVRASLPIQYEKVMSGDHQKPTGKGGFLVIRLRILSLFFRFDWSLDFGNPISWIGLIPNSVDVGLAYQIGDLITVVFYPFT